MKQSKLQSLIDSQKGEILTNLLRAYIAVKDQTGAPLFVKVGANDGFSGDPCGDIRSTKRWRGCLIEPVPYAYNNLERAFGQDSRYRLFNLAISDVNGTAKLYHVREEAPHEIPELPSWWDKLASFNEGHIEKHFDGLLAHHVTSIDVPVQNLQTFFESNNIHSLSLLHVDTEGHDYVVVKSFDLSSIQPAVIIYESKHLDSCQRADLLKHLKMNGYQYIYDAGNDVLAFRNFGDAIVPLIYSYPLVWGRYLSYRCSRLWRSNR